MIYSLKEYFWALLGREILFFWLATQDSQFFIAPKTRESRHFLHRDKSA